MKTKAFARTIQATRVTFFCLLVTAAAFGSFKLGQFWTANYSRTALVNIQPVPNIGVGDLIAMGSSRH